MKFQRSELERYTNNQMSQNHIFLAQSLLFFSCFFVVGNFAAATISRCNVCCYYEFYCFVICHHSLEHCLDCCCWLCSLIDILMTRSIFLRFDVHVPHLQLKVLFVCVFVVAYNKNDNKKEQP